MAEVKVTVTLDGDEATKRKLGQLGKSLEGLNPPAKIATDRLQNLGSTLGGLGTKLSLFLTAPVLAAGAAIAKMGIDAVESQNLVDVAFGDMAGAARKWADDTSKALGLNRFETQKTLATLQEMMVGMVGNRDAAFEMSKGLIRLTQDLASLKNISVEAAFQKLRSGIVGETEGLKQLGIVINETKIETFALESGMIKFGEKMTEQQKVVARYGSILQQTSLAQGDLARTMDSPANQLRALKAKVTETATELGVVFLPIVSAVLSALVILGTRLSAAVERFKLLAPETQKTVLMFGAFLIALGPLLKVTGFLITGFAALTRIIGKLGIISAVTPLFVALGSALATWPGIIAIAATATTAFVASQTELLDSVKETLSTLAQPIGEAFGAATEAVGKAFDGMIDSIVGGLGEIPGVAELTGQGLVSEYEGVSKAIAESIAGGSIQMTKSLSDFAKTAGKDSVAATEEARKAWEKWFEDINKFYVEVRDTRQKFREEELQEIQEDLEYKLQIQKIDLKGFLAATDAQMDAARGQDIQFKDLIKSRRSAIERDYSFQKGIIEKNNGTLRGQIAALEALAAQYRELGPDAAGSLNTIQLEIDEINAKLTGGTRTAFDGAKSALEDYEIAYNDKFGRMKTFTSGALQAMESAIAGFFNTGKFSFKDFFDAVKAGLAQLAAQEVVGTIGSIFGLMGNGTSSGGSGGGLLGGIIKGGFGSMFGGVGEGLGSSLIGSIGGIASTAYTGISNFFSGLFASGGQVRGPGGPREDKVLARVSPGEYIVNAASARASLPLLEAINNAPGYASGGSVSGGSFSNMAKSAFMNIAPSALSGIIGNALGFGGTMTGVINALSGLTGFTGSTAGAAIAADAALMSAATGTAAAGGTIAGVGNAILAAGPQLLIGLALSFALSKLMKGKPSVGPNAGANLNIVDGRVVLGSSAADNRGDSSIAITMAQEAAHALNALAAMSGSTVKAPTGRNLIDSGTGQTLLGSVGYFPTRGGVFGGALNFNEYSRPYFGSNTNAAVQNIISEAVGLGVVGDPSVAQSNMAQALELAAIAGFAQKLGPAIGGTVAAAGGLTGRMGGAYAQLRAKGDAVMSSMATGGDLFVTRPTLVRMGEAGPERASFRPAGAGGSGGGGATIVLAGPTIMSETTMRRFVRTMGRKLDDQYHTSVYRVGDTRRIRG